MILKIAKDSFEKWAYEYTDLLGYFYPAREHAGFTERNLTYHFCKNFEQAYQSKNSGKCFSWMEYPLEKYKSENSERWRHPHIDAVIFIFEEKSTSAIYVEAKRITENNYDQKYKSILSDIQRIKEKKNRNHILDKKYFFDPVNLNFVKEYICYLADVWIGNKEKSLSVPPWWKEKLPELAGLSNKRIIFEKEVMIFSEKSKYNLLGFIDEL